MWELSGGNAFLALVVASSADALADFSADELAALSGPDPVLYPHYGFYSDLGL